MDIIEKRSSTRLFKSADINIGTLKQIISAGLTAPSPKNRQPWEFIVIVDKKKKNDLANSMKIEIEKLLFEKPGRKDIKASLDTIEIIRQAPVLVLVCYVNNMVDIHDDGVNWVISAKDVEAVEIQSIGAAVENMLLKAEALGIGSLWCADVLYAYNSISQFSSFPIISAVCFGYKQTHSTSPSRKNIDEKCKFI